MVSILRTQASVGPIQFRQSAEACMLKLLRGSNFMRSLLNDKVGILIKA